MVIIYVEQQVPTQKKVEMCPFKRQLKARGYIFRLFLLFSNVKLCHVGRSFNLLFKFRFLGKITAYQLLISFNMRLMKLSIIYLV